MKGKLSRMQRSCLSLMLVFCMLVSMAPAVFAVESTETIHYVSLGDSMTNGYGLSNYANQGHNTYGNGAYPDQFADWLVENGYADEVDHSRLAVSAMRAEDLHWILEYPNGYQGDQYTINNFINGRFNHVNEFAGAAAAATEYQNAVKNADIISVGTGGANFGVFLLYSMIDAVGALGDTDDGYAWVKFEDALVECDAETKAFAMQAYDIIKESLITEIPADAEEIAAKLADRIAYVTVSYALHYGGVLDAIATLNPNAEVIIVGLMNNLNGMAIDFTIDGQSFEFSIGELMGTMVGYINVYLAGLPATLQANGKYSGNVFYYADSPDVEMIVDALSKELMQDANSVARDRTISEMESFIWPMLNELFGEGSYVDISTDDVAAYETAVNTGTAAVAAWAESLNPNKAQSIATYVAFENAALAAAKMEGNLNGASLTKLMDMSSVTQSFDSIYKTFEENVVIEGVAYNDDLIAFAETQTDETVSREAITYLIKESALMAAYQLVADEMNQTTGQSLTAEDVKLAYTTDESIKTAVDAAEANLKEVKSSIEALRMLLAMPEAMSKALETDEDMPHLLHLFARMMVGDGIGCHPSKAGHNSVFNAVTLSYTEKHTVQEETKENTEIALDRMYKLVRDYFPKLAEELWGLNKEPEFSNADEATNADLVLGEDGYYVALGDGSTASPSYVDKVVDQLEVENEVVLDFINYANANHTIKNAYAVIEANATDLAKANLITVGYGNAAFADAAIKQMVNAMMDPDKIVAYDWEALVGEEGAKVVAQILDEIYAELVANGLDFEIKIGTDENTSVAEAMKLAIESYAYGVVEYAVELPGVIADLREINQDAVIAIVGMYNPLKGVTLTHEEMSINVGEYIDYLVEAANAYGLGYCMATSNAIFVEAPDTETSVQNKQFDILPFLMQSYMGAINLNPTDAGHEYIKGEIMDALNVVEESEEDPDHPDDPETREGVVRYSGKTRYQTSQKIADALMEEMGGEKFDAVVLANAMKFPDALVGSYLANQKGAPILLTDEKNAADVNAYINENLAEDGTVYVLGGTAAVSEEALEGLNTKNIERLSGESRIETNLAILEEAGVSGGAILICTAYNYADSLSASAANLPILLVGDSLTTAQKEFLKANSGNLFFIIGGTAAVNEEVAEDVADIMTFGFRLKGSNRYETSVIVANAFAGENKTAVLASGEDFPDGLCGGPLAYSMNAPVILTSNSFADDAADYVAEHDIKGGVVLGGTGRIDDSTVRKIFALDAKDTIEVK